MMLQPINPLGQSPMVAPAQETAFRLPTLSADAQKLLGAPLMIGLALMFAGGIFAQKKKRFELSRKRGKWGIR